MSQSFETCDTYPANAEMSATGACPPPPGLARKPEGQTRGFWLVVHAALPINVLLSARSGAPLTARRRDPSLKLRKVGRVKPRKALRA